MPQKEQMIEGRNAVLEALRSERSVDRVMIQDGVKEGAIGSIIREVKKHPETKLDFVQKSGSWYSMGETRIGQGRDAAKQYLKDNPEVADRLEADIRANFDKLMTGQQRIAAKAAGRAVDVSADDFEG